MEDFSLIFRILFGLDAAMLIFLVWAIDNHLKKNHLHVWTELGEPHIIFNNNKKTLKAKESFIKSKIYLELNDEKLNSLVSKLNFSIYVAWTFFGIGCVLLIAVRTKFIQ